MENYKLATREKYRFQTIRGLLSTEQLWDLSITDLDTLAVSLDAEYKESGKKSFLVVKSEKDKTAKLKFDIVLDILNTKQEEAEVAKNKAAVKAHNTKILQLIADKQDDELKGKSVKQLTALLQD